VPSLTLQIPTTEWNKLKVIAEAEGVSVRILCLWKLQGEFGLPIRRLTPAPPPAEEAAA
jgi:hypothetical protein